MLRLLRTVPRLRLTIEGVLRVLRVLPDMGGVFALLLLKTPRAGRTARAASPVAVREDLQGREARLRQRFGYDANTRPPPPRSKAMTS